MSIRILPSRLILVACAFFACAVLFILFVPSSAHAADDNSPIDAGLTATATDSPDGLSENSADDFVQSSAKISNDAEDATDASGSIQIASEMKPAGIDPNSGPDPDSGSSTLTPLPTVAGVQGTLVDKQTTQETVTMETQDMFRLYNPNSGEHFYTANSDERDYLSAVGWSYEGVGWTAPNSSDNPVYRLYNPNAGDHHYTLSADESNWLVSLGWSFEGIGWYSADSSEGTPVFRQYNPNATAGSHNFTTSAYENAALVELGWSFELIGWYALTSTSEVVEHTTSIVKATAPYLTATFSTSADKALETIVSYGNEDATYLFFPAYAPLTKVALNAYNAQGEQVRFFISSGTGYILVDPTVYIDLTSLGGKTDANGNIYLSFASDMLESIFSLTVMKSANIPAIYVNSVDVDSKGRAYIEASDDHSAKASVAVSMVDADGNIIYNSDDITSSKKISSIKGRGNSSWENGDKKPYQISLGTKSELIGGAGKAKKWILLANSADATLLHSSVAFDLAAELGLDTVDSTPVDLYYDGEYRGSYLLTEKVQIDKARIDIFDLEEAIEDANPDADLDSLPTEIATNRFGNQFQYVKEVADPSDITGGYLLELDNGYYGKEKCWFVATWPSTNDITHFVVKSPEVASYNAIKYISEAVQEALNNLAAGQTNLGNGIFSFDLDSFAKMYLIEEFTKNIDAYVSSTYFYLDAGSTVIMSGPVWDFDAGMGTRIDANNSLQNTYSGIYLFVADNPVFRSSVKERVVDIYKDSFSGLIKNILLSSSKVADQTHKLQSIVWYADRIAASQRMNEIPFGVTSFAFQADPFSTWALNINYFYKWVYWRASWFNENYFNIGDSSVTNANRFYGGFDYGLVFDYEYYLDQNPDVAALYSNPRDVILHFILYGMSQGRIGSRNFDVNAYRVNNPKLVELFGDNLAAYYYHFCTDGFKAGLVSWS